MPRQLDGFRHARELYWMDQIGVGGQLDDLVLQNLERSHVFGAELHEQGRGFRIESFPIGRGVREGLAGGGESGGDHQLDGGGSETDEAGDKADRFVDGWDRYPSDAGHAGSRNGVDHGLGDERQRSLGSHEKTTKDFERRLAVEQSAEPVAMGVPYRILSSHAVDQLPIGEQLSAEFQQPDRKIRFGSFECRLRVGSRGVDYGAGWRYERHRRDGLVGVVSDGAAHAAGVVGNHASDGACVRTCRIRSEPSAVSPEHCVDVAEDHSWTRAHAAAIVLHFGAIPMTAHVDQNIVRLRLTVEARSRGAKRRVPSVLSAIAEELDDVIGRSRLHDNLRDEPIRARIGGIPYEIDRSVEDVLFSQKGDEIGLQVAWCPVDQRGGDCIALWWPVEPSYARRVRGK